MLTREGTPQERFEALLIVVAGLVLFGENNFSDDFLWLLLVVIWALTVPHMMVTAKLDRGALL